MNILAIDPGNEESAYTVIDGDRRPLWFAKVPNDELRGILWSPQVLVDWDVDRAACEMVASYGMPVGREVFETCVAIGRFCEVISRTGRDVELVYRKAVKLHHCGTTQAKDAHVRQALVDRFAERARNYGKGTKADPGWFYGFAADVWQAYAVAVYVADTEGTP